MILLVMAPVALTLAAWFVNAPDPRFAWGSLIALGLVPLSILAAELQLGKVWAGVSTVVLLALLMLAGLRGSLSALSWSFGETPRATLLNSALADGTPVTNPTGSDQCWDAQPLCRPDYADPGVSSRGPSIQDGFSTSTETVAGRG